MAPPKRADVLYKEIIKASDAGALKELPSSLLSAYIELFDFAKGLYTVEDLGDIFRPREHRNSIERFLPKSSRIGDLLKSKSMGANRNGYEYSLCVGWWLQYPRAAMRLLMCDRTFICGDMDAGESANALQASEGVFLEWGMDALACGEMLRK